MQVKTEVEVEELPETGEGSEYGRKRREEARRRRRGYNMRAPDPDAQPWVLKERKKGGKQYVMFVSVVTLYLIFIPDVEPFTMFWFLQLHWPERRDSQQQLLLLHFQVSG